MSPGSRISLLLLSLLIALAGCESDDHAASIEPTRRLVVSLSDSPEQSYRCAGSLGVYGTELPAGASPGRPMLRVTVSCPFPSDPSFDWFISEEMISLLASGGDLTDGLPDSSLSIKVGTTFATRVWQSVDMPAAEDFHLRIALGPPLLNGVIVPDLGQTGYAQTSGEWEMPVRCYPPASDTSGAGEPLTHSYCRDAIDALHLDEFANLK